MIRPISKLKHRFSAHFTFSFLISRPTEAPIRSELFSLERFDEHARSLAVAQTITLNPRSGARLTPRLAENEKILQQSYRYLVGEVQKNKPVNPAGEWLMDSFYVVEEQLRDIKRFLPNDFYNELPKLSDGFLKGYPRVYGLAWAYVAHTDSRFDPDSLYNFVRSYQQVQPLTIGELWALAITLRVVMVDNLRRIAIYLVTSQEARQAADAFVDEILGLIEESTETARPSAAKLEKLSAHSAFLVQLIQRLRYQDPAETPAVRWLNERMAVQKVTADEMVTSVHNQQAANNQTVRNIITSFRSMIALDWQEFFESVSPVQEILTRHPNFLKMDFMTRNSYRSAVEEIAKGSKKSELEIARWAVQKAEEASQKPVAERYRDPGYYLFAEGRRAFEKEVGFRVLVKNRFVRLCTDHPSVTYIGDVILVTGLILWIAALLNPTLPLFGLLLLLVFGIFPAGDLAVSRVNRLVTGMAPPQHLSRLELPEGPTADFRTFVVVPTILGSETEIPEQFEKLEVNFLSNSEGDVRFALLTDWPDSDADMSADDLKKLPIAAQCAAALNQKHGPAPNGGPRFFFFHRKRLWNPLEGKWMGWERKRGKLHEFNKLLRGSTDTSYFNFDGSPLVVPYGVRYVVTLDADTKLPTGVVNQLVGILAHPLQQALVDPQLHKVVEGYGILQPRITSFLPNQNEKSIFQKLFSGECGIDPYASAVSDVYQDLFGEGSFTGKGIYDVDAYEQSMADRIPENSLLSHDLFEGSFVRCGYASDLEFFEDFPSHAEISTVRNHRWIRGDWQLLPWIFGRDKAGLTVLAKWKMIDNLRRSLSPIGTVALLITAFCLPSANRPVWVSLALLGLALPSFISFFDDLAFWHRSLHWRDHLIEIKSDFLLGQGQFIVNLVLIANRAWMHLDAITRTLWRLFVTKKNLLEWVTAAQAKSASSLTFSSFLRRMKGSLALALLAGLATAWLNPRALPLCLPFVFLWLTAPWFARWISLPETPDKTLPLQPQEIEELRLYGRRIGRFFSLFGSAQDNYLPADNFQEDPVPVTAHRSSPTNFGLYLLSIVTAHDFGWSGLGDMADRLEATLKTLKELPRFRGHFYNWYDTQTQQVLEPQYISSVDSGNLAGHLLTLSQACQDLIHRPLFSTADLAGIKDSVLLFKRAVQELQHQGRTAATPLGQLQKEIALFENQLDGESRFTSHAKWADYWDKLSLQAEALKDAAHSFASHQKDKNSELIIWADQVADDVKSHVRDFRQWFSWVYALDSDHKTDHSAQEKEFQSSIQNLLSPGLTLAQTPGHCEKALESFESLRQSQTQKSTEDDIYFDHVTEALTLSVKNAREALRRLSAIANLSHELFDEMDFSFLLNPKKKLFAIGYRVPEAQLDESCYDLLASEARLTSYVAIIKGDAPVSHWFRLGRGLVAEKGEAMLVSWSGTMFEYLMPSLVMMTSDGSLIDQTCQRVIQRQIEYGKLREVPWGISESGYNARDLNLNYQYSNFGVPGLGLKRGLSKDLVVAPYATALASMINPRQALQNLKRLEQIGARSTYGFYEALDYTPSRVRENQKFELVRSYMAHHQGMSLLSFSNVVHQGLLRRRFHMDPLVQSGELLLQERTPRHLGAARDQVAEVEVKNILEPLPAIIRKIRSPHHPIPSSHLLSNGRYAVMITAAGSGYSLWKNRAVTRWREDVTQDHSGNYLYLRDMQKGSIWSATYQPTLINSEQSEVLFSEDKAKISRLDYSITTDLEVIVSAEDDAELRRLTLTNHGTDVREIEITSYSEVVLAPPDADLAHPAFSNLFIETGFLPELSALTASRRPRSSTEEKVFMAQVLSSEGDTFGEVEYETDRSQFIGRGRTLRKPISVTDGLSLSNTIGAVLDPILSLRIRVRLQPGASAKVCYTTLVSGSEAEMLAMAEKYHNASAFERSSNLVWTQSKAKLYHLDISLDEAQLFQKLANRLIFSDPLMRPASEVLKKNRMNISGLWSRGISGDRPILLARIDDMEDQGLVRQLLRAHEYWRMKRLSVDIVILNDKATSYVQDLQTTLEGLVRGSEATSSGNPDLPPGKIFVLRADLLDVRERELLLAVARAILHSHQGTLAEQVMRVRKLDNFKTIPADRFDELETFRLQNREEPPLAVPGLEFFNGIGGFAEDGKEYVIVLEKGQRTPAPWINVIANPDFGFQVSESGAGYTWSLNSRENQISPWSNDPVVDPTGEAFYICDLDSDQVWSPTASPIRLEGALYKARHGAGYSVFENGSNEIHSELTQFVDTLDPVKISRLVLENRSDKRRHLLVTAYVEWVLGFSRVKTAPSIVTERDEETGALFAVNHLDMPFGNRVSFLSVNANQTSWTADRSEFIGRNGNLERPAALLRKDKLSGSTGAGLDPCGVLQLHIDLAPGEKKEISFFLGQTDSPENARRLAQKYRRASLETSLQTVTDQWIRLLGKTQVQTPDRSMDILLNHWLLYQTLACRFWARSAFYQAGGAFGFRDQLQDVMAIVAADPRLAREHILKTAARQFLEGDVQHWWHPLTGRGVRTRISDDRLWLPYVVLHYLKTTGDESLLDELVPFLEGPPLNPGQEDSYYDPSVSRDAPLSLYEHCVRAINVSLKTGMHDLPLMGSGDWNDGMNRVGHEGQGESIWLAWFLHDVLTQMAPVAARRGDVQWKTVWTEHAAQLKTALEANGWDGQWYKRAYFDDGTPLGSHENSECQIDSIAQSWAVLSGAGDPQRSVQAMQSVEDRLVRLNDKMILLFIPPFNNTPKDPGYIKGYLPGVRENGGQYTHAAVWTVCATAQLGLGSRAAELFAMINPINHALTRTNVGIYKSEPYVMAADIYSQPPHVGRGGWTWYTGSSGWMYRAGTEFILGIHQRGQKLHFDPCIPKEWPGFKVIYQYGETPAVELQTDQHDWNLPTIVKTVGTTYEIQFENPNHVSKGVQSIELDGETVLGTNATIELKDDQKKHRVKVIM
jgi:cyclic beta-1,2-glucan synthetase